LFVGIDQQEIAASLRSRDSQIYGQCGFTYATLSLS
jgi:hypothetical protein